MVFWEKARLFFFSQVIVAAILPRPARGVRGPESGSVNYDGEMISFGARRRA